MKKLILSTLFCFAASAALATTPEGCERIGNSNNYRCNVDGGTYRVENVNSAEAAALAIAAQQQQQGQGQAQGQDQSQSSSNTNQNVNGGNSVNVEGAPKHTTSANFGLSVGVSVPVNQGFVERERRAWADWYLQNGDSCTAFIIADKNRFVRAAKLKRNCGDKD